MSTSAILSFAADHPYSAFCLSWPIGLILISVAWSVATLLTNAMNACAMVFSQTTGFLAVLIRGYPPSAPRDEKVDGGEEKPLAG